MSAKLTREQVEKIVEAARQKGQRPDLSEAILAELDLSELDLSQTNLSLANLHRANLYKANLNQADLTGATLFITNLGWANLSEANLTEAKLGWADLNGANLSRANLSNADLSGANLFDANLTEANLTEADLLMSNLNDANLTKANLTEAKLTGAILIHTDFTAANLTGCSVYGISAWDLTLDGAKQSSLNISRWNEPAITVDSLEIAQFIHLLLHNDTVRHVVDTITSNIVLILGCFKPEQKLVMEILEDELRQRDYSPIICDFEHPSSEDFTERISTLARMSRFVIVDLTRAKNISPTLTQVIPELSSVPIQPIVSSADYDPQLLTQFKHYPWVLDVYEYDSLSNLLAFFTEKVIVPIEIRSIETAR